jgi:SAM-dependent methyltransferase
VTASQLPAGLLEVLEPLGQEVDEVVAETCHKVIDANADRWSPWEIAQGFEDLWNLSAGKDCTYDRPSIGVSYALWYHGKRTQEAVRILLPEMLGNEGPFHLLDLGCGTGATATAVLVSLAALERSGLPVPTEVVVRGVDASPFMVDLAEQLAADMKAAFGLDGSIDLQFEVRTWTDARSARLQRPILFASYLFDQSDQRNVAQLAAGFRQVGDRLGCTKAFVLTSQRKADLGGAATAALIGEGWQEGALVSARPIWHGALARCHEVRRRWYTGCDLVPASRLSTPPDWASAPVYFSSVTPGGGESVLFDPTGPTLLLDDEQEEAARLDDRLTFVAGAAGSGKSRVLAERLVRTLEAARRQEPPRILVTSFNKAMVDQLAEWLLERCEMSSTLKEVSATKREGGWHVLTGVNGDVPVEVTLINRDRLPHRLFGAPSPSWPMAKWKGQIQTRLAAQPGVDAGAWFLDDEFLMDELERVILNASVLSREDYQTVGRAGRRKPLPVRNRGVVWDLLMAEPRPDSFVHRRIGAYEMHVDAIEREEQLDLHSDLAGPWTNVFVDEAQDFTAVEIKMLGCVPPDPNRLFLAGDPAQSMHLGPSYRRPGFKRRVWNKHELGGSYRLPIRVCEALEDLALAYLAVSTTSEIDADLLDLVLPESRKAAVLGPRPVVVAGDPMSVGNDLREVFAAYRPLIEASGGSVTVAEDDEMVAASVAAAAPWAQVARESMRSIKGLERACIVFSDRAQVGEESAAEWIFTILTRATTLLVVVMSPDAPPATKAILGRLREDRLLFWDQRAKGFYLEARAHIGSGRDPLSSQSLP